MGITGEYVFVITLKCGHQLGPCREPGKGNCLTSFPGSTLVTTVEIRFYGDEFTSLGITLQALHQPVGF
jgi:hypothetical protein